MTIADALIVAAQTRADLAGSEITYRRGKHSATFRATLGQSAFEAFTSEGGVLKVQTRDYCFLTSYLVLNEIATEPQRGDLIEQTFGNQTLVYQVLPPTDDEQCFRYADQFHIELRVHTQRKK